MSCIIIPPISSISILDANVVAKLQSALAINLPWLDACYGIAEVSEMKKDNGSIERFPRVYSNTNGAIKNYIDIRYNDSLKAQIFFERNGQIKFGKSDEQDSVTYPLSLICWANLSKIDCSNPFDYKDILAGNVCKVIRDNFKSNIDWELDIEMRSKEAYSKYTMSDIDNRFITLPYTAFRISFSWIEFQSGECYSFMTNEYLTSENTCDNLTDEFLNPLQNE